MKNFNHIQLLKYVEMKEQVNHPTAQAIMLEKQHEILQHREEISFTVMLAVTADGKKLPLKVTLRGVQSPRDFVVPDSICVSFHKKGWMDEASKFTVLCCSFALLFTCV